MMSAEAMDTTAALPEATIEQIIADIVELVECESCSYDREGLGACLRLLTGLVVRRLGEPAKTHRYSGGEFGDIVTSIYPGIGTGHVTIIGHYGCGETRLYADMIGRQTALLKGLLHRLADGL